MNERLKELAVLANIEFTYDPTETPVRAFAECWEEDLEKFAELILKECMSYADDSFGDVDYVKFMIKRDFGVEE